ncbi:MAG: HAMP domain-containing histidine kinase [Flavobacterium sp.]|nr:HAMP domain-containing histidine kinase [Pedobacter sp.]
MVELANKNVQKLTSLVNDLLDFTKLEKGQLVLRKSIFTLSDLLNSCCETMRIDGFIVKIDGDINIKVSADYLKIEQVVTNLLNNCIKYASQTKEIIIHCERTPDSVKVSVEDFGPGIPKEKLSHLFAIYYRADNKGQQYSGLGLGLYICSRIIADHDGRIGVESELGKGTSFWFTIPC